MLSWVKTGNKLAPWGHSPIWQHLVIYSTLIFTLIFIFRSTQIAKIATLYPGILCSMIFFQHMITQRPSLM